MPPVERLGRLFFALALVGFGLENIVFGHYVVARAAPWPADPAQQHLTAYVTGVAVRGLRRRHPGRPLDARGGAPGRRPDPGLVAVPALAEGDRRRHVQRRLDQRPEGRGPGRRRRRSWRSAPANRASPLLSGLGRVAPHACAPFFLLAGIQHILFVQFVETLVPPFIPFARFWTYVAAAALLAAGFGLLAPPVRRLAAILTGWMVFSWVFLVHVPLIFRIGPLEWQGVFEALGISGVCFLLADADRS